MNLTRISGFLQQIGVSQSLWLLDSPVSNSGRLKTLITELSRKNRWNWQIELVINPDARLIKTESIAVSSDGVVLDGCTKWFNLAAEIIKSQIHNAKIIDLS